MGFRSELTLPLALLAVMVLTDGLAFCGVLPGKSGALSAISIWLATGGVAYIYIIAFLENVAFLNFYFPGSIAILAAMAGTGGDVSRVAAVWLLVTFGAVTGSIFDVQNGRISHSDF
jgi:membrane protein DedA with SNARE-associated domain